MTNSRFNVVIRNPDGSISISKGVRIDDNVSINTQVVVKKKKRLKPLIKMKSEVSEHQVILCLPLQTISEANCFEHWTKKHARHKKQQRIVSLALKPLRDQLKLPCNIMLTRLAPDELDTFDNLPMSFKYIVDAICAIITGNYKPGQADGDKRISIACDQVKNKEYGIIIELTF